MAKKALAIALVALLAFAGIVSCSKASNSKSSEKVSSVASASASESSAEAKKKKKSSKPKVITADDVPSVRRGQKVTVTGELSTAAPNSRVDPINDYTDIVLNLNASDGALYKVYAFAMRVDIDDIRDSYPDIDTGTLLNSGDTKYNMTLTGKVSRVNHGDESDKLLGFELENATIVDATPI